MGEWHQETVRVEAQGRGLLDVTDPVRKVARNSGIHTGLCHVFLQHTSASLVLQENADADVLRDLMDWFSRTVPDGDPRYRHAAEGPDDMSAHIRTALTQTAISIPVTRGDLALGTWQALYLFEHRTTAHPRRLVVTLHGIESA